MKTIELTKGHVAFVDDDMYDFLSQWKWRYSNNYAVRGDRTSGKYKTIWMHRVILAVVNKNIYVDHKDCNTLNNQLSNLRLADKHQNGCNRGNQCNNTSGYKGVSWFKPRKKWRVRIRLRGRQILVGFFADITDAAKAYNEAASVYHGEFAKLNIIKEPKK